MANNMQSKDPNILDAANSSGYPTDPPPYSGYPHPPPQYITQQPVQVTTVVPGAVIIHQMVGSDPTHITCRVCNMTMVTRVEKKPSTRTHIMAACLCLFGFWPCVCIPYCVDSCLNTDHYCTNCGTFVGTYMR